MDSNIIPTNNINAETFDKDIEKVPIQIPEEFEDLSNEEAARKYGID